MKQAAAAEEACNALKILQVVLLRHQKKLAHDWQKDVDSPRVQRAAAAKAIDLRVHQEEVRDATEVIFGKNVAGVVRAAARHHLQ